MHASGFEVRPSHVAFMGAQSLASSFLAHVLSLFPAHILFEVILLFLNPIGCFYNKTDSVGRS